MMFPGLGDRLKKAMENLFEDDAPKPAIQVVTPDPDTSPDRKYCHSVWRGGAVFASVSMFYKGMITRQEYHECGVSVVHRRCF